MLQGEVRDGSLRRAGVLGVGEAFCLARARVAVQHFFGAQVT